MKKHKGTFAALQQGAGIINDLEPEITDPQFMASIIKSHPTADNFLQLFRQNLKSGRPENQYSLLGFPAQILWLTGYN
jgi:hypothetical protein